MEKHIFIQVNSLILLLILFSAGCATKEKIAGKYSFQYKPGYTKLKLNPNNTFTYYMNLELSGIDTFYGTWDKNYRTIKLNVTKPEIRKYYNPKDSVAELYVKSSDSIVFEVFYEDSIPELTPIVINLNNTDDQYIKSDLKGIAKLPLNYPLKQFYVGYIGEPGIHYEVKNKNSNYFKVFLYTTGWIQPYTHRAIYYRWKYKNNTIYPIDNKTDKVIKKYPHKKHK